jgi:long-subunit acyl-CoA synthetase (AMP-forming)
VPPLPSDLALIFLGAGIPILQGYGLTETSPAVSFNRPGNNRIGTIGQPIPGVKVRGGRRMESYCVQGGVRDEGLLPDARGDQPR